MSGFSAFAIGAPATGSGKTTVTLALMTALRARGSRVQPFKVGPAFIDPAYHAAICGRPSINLDAWMTSDRCVRETFAHHAHEADVAIVEGMMGLFDGEGDGDERASTAHIAKLLGIPAVLVVDAYTASETVAASALGCSMYDPALTV